MPRLRGRPAGRLGQAFYGWLGGATIGSLGRFNGLLRIRPLKRPEQGIAFGKPAVKRLAYLPFGMARKRAKYRAKLAELIEGYFWAKPVLTPGNLAPRLIISGLPPSQCGKPHSALLTS